MDGNLYETRYPGVSSPPTLFIPSWPLYMIMNVAISWWGPQPQPPVWWLNETFMYVDWVKIWQQPSAGHTLTGSAVPQRASADQGLAAAG